MLTSRWGNDTWSEPSVSIAVRSRYGKTGINTNSIIHYEGHKYGDLIKTLPNRLNAAVVVIGIASIHTSVKISGTVLHDLGDFRSHSNVFKDMNVIPVATLNQYKEDLSTIKMRNLLLQIDDGDTIECVDKGLDVLLKITDMYNKPEVIFWFNN